MTPFLAYLLKSSVSIALLFVLYKLTMSNDNSHKLNRYLLLGILVVSAFLPFVNFPFFQEKSVVSQVEFVRDFFVSEIQPFDFVPSSIESDPISEKASIHINLLLFFYLLAIIFLFIKLVISVARILQLMKKAQKKGFQQFVLMVVKEFIQPFSFLNRIFISEADYESNKKILIAHEAEHIRKKHFIDLFLVEIFVILHWFNPFMWLLKSELKLVHEYQADRAVLQKGIDAKKYQLLVLEKAVGERRFAMANYFTQKPIQKRIKMMKKNKLYRWSWFKLLLFAPIVLLLLQAFASPENLVKKAGEYVPAIIQQDSSTIWIDSWVSSKMDILMNESFNEKATSDKTFNAVNIVDSDLSLNEEGTNTYTKNNVFSILQNSKGDLLVENKPLKIENLKTSIKAYLKGTNEISGEVPGYKTEDLPYVGKVKISHGVILFRKDIDTPRSAIEAVMKSIGEAVLEVRNEVANDKFGEDYFVLSNEKKDVVKEIIPANMSFISPMAMKKNPPPPPPPIERSKRIKSPPPPPPNAIELTLKKNGKVMFGKEEYNIDEIQQKIIDLKKERMEMYKKWDINPELVTSMKIETGVSDEQVSAIKEALRKARVQNLNLSFESKKME